MAPRGGVLGAYGINFGERDVRIRESVVQPDCLEQQRDGIVLASLDAVQLRQLKIGARIRGIARDPLPLRVDVAARFERERRLNHFFAPEAHFGDGISIGSQSAIAFSS